MLKVSARWVHRFLTLDQKLTELVMSEANLTMFEADLDGCAERFLPKMSVRSITSKQSPKGNLCNGIPRLLLLLRRPRWCHRQERLWPSCFRLQKALRKLTNL